MSENIEIPVEKLRDTAFGDDETFLEVFYELANQEPFTKVTMNAWELKVILEMKDHIFQALTETLEI